MRDGIQAIGKMLLKRWFEEFFRRIHHVKKEMMADSFFRVE